MYETEKELKWSASINLHKIGDTVNSLCISMTDAICTVNRRRKNFVGYRYKVRGVEKKQ